jgi:hypothetical protein
MAVSHVLYDPNSPYGSRLRNALRTLENGVSELNDVLGIMTLMLDGGVATAYLAARFGTADAAVAQSLYNEISALMAKLNTDASVTNVKTAIAQAIQKLG